MNDVISPKYQMKLVSEIEAILWETFPTPKYRNVKFYIEKWHESDQNYWQNFQIYANQDGTIDLLKTLHGMESEIIIKIAIDLGVNTPDFIPSVPVFKNELKNSFKNPSQTFEKALKEVESNPDIAVGIANSTLESIIKHILDDDRVSLKLDKKKTLYDLTADILKVFSLYPIENHPVEEIRNIGSALLKACQNIEVLRSNKTLMHGKTDKDYTIDNPMYAYFIINSVTTIGLFLNSFYKINFPKVQVVDTVTDYGGNTESIPF